jgi:hypothetical protein
LRPSTPTFERQIDLAYYLMVLGLIAIYGPGALSVDSLVVRTLRRHFPELEALRMVSYNVAPARNSGIHSKSV